MTGGQLTPLRPREFFRGKWEGHGEFVPLRLVRWLYPRQEVHYFCEAQWLTETIWVVPERAEFSSGAVIERKMFCELVTPDRIHVTADDMPLGADIHLHENGFRFTPYYTWSGLGGGRKWLLRLHDENVLGPDGRIHDTIHMYYHKIRVATMRLVFTVDRNESSSP